MANIKYFVECGGCAVQLSHVQHDGLGNGHRANEFSGLCLCGQRHVAQRKVEYKQLPSKHECDARCTGATGKVMRCECSCSGKNHGRGAFSGLLV